MESSIHTLDELYQRREKEVVFLLSKFILEKHFTDGAGEAKVWYFPQIKAIVEQWIGQYVRLKDNCKLQLLLLSENAYTAAEKLYRAIVSGTNTDEKRLR